MSIKRRSRKTTIISMFLVVAVAGAAYAYWTASGSGTGTAETGASVPLTVNQVTVLDPMYPGDSPQTISGTFTNTNEGPIYVTSVTASIASVTGGDGACSAADYVLANEVMTVEAEVPVGTGVGTWSGATLQFDNTLENQDGCQNATVNLAYTVNII